MTNKDIKRIYYRNTRYMEKTEFEHIAIAIRERARNTALASSLTTEEAEDLAQDVMLKLWTLHDEIKGKDGAFSLANAMTRHLVIDYYRKNRSISIDLKTNLIDEKNATPDKDYEYQENEEWLLHKMKALPSKEYQILRLRQVEQKSNEEIANILGIEKKSVATMLSRARIKLLKDIKRRIN